MLLMSKKNQNNRNENNNSVLGSTFDNIQEFLIHNKKDEIENLNKFDTINNPNKDNKRKLIKSKTNMIDYEIPDDIIKINSDNNNIININTINIISDEGFFNQIKNNYNVHNNLLKSYENNYINNNFKDNIHFERKNKSNYKKNIINKLMKQKNTININNNDFMNSNNFNENNNEYIDQDKKIVNDNINNNNMTITKDISDIKENIDKIKNKNISLKRNKTFEKKKKIINESKTKNKILNPSCFLFENINIFNSMLIIMNNISYINNYFLKERTKTIINNCDCNNQYCLSCILYYMHKYMWNYRDKQIISQNSLSKKYLNFIDCYTKTNCQNSNPQTYCYNIDNLQKIINFIYNKINNELSSENLKMVNYTENDSLSKYINEFFKKNKSIISDNFIGFYENKIFCVNCENKKQRYNIKNDDNIKANYSPLYYINFNLNEIKNYLIKENKRYKNNMYFNYYNFNDNGNDDISINLYKCLDYTLGHNNNYESYCNCCFLKTQKVKYNSIFLLPYILTIILSNNDNYNFIIDDELDLKQYINNRYNSSYYLISILCQISYNKQFIIYCINPYNGLWYSYTNDNIKEVQKMDLNAVPLVLIYQVKNNINIYKPIKRENNKILLNVKFSNSINSINIFFSKNDNIKNVIEKISLIKNIEKSKITLIVEGKKTHNDQIISEITKNNNIIILAIIN